MKKFAIIRSQFNDDITLGLLRGAESYLKEQGVEEIDTFEAPGAFELPLIAKRLAKTQKYSGVICLGCVIKGETAHFEFISLSSSVGLMQGMLDTDVPISFGVLTVYSRDQARVRSQPGPENKGIEAASACYQTAQLLSQI